MAIKQKIGYCFNAWPGDIQLAEKLSQVLTMHNLPQLAILQGNCSYNFANSIILPESANKQQLSLAGANWLMLSLNAMANWANSNNLNWLIVLDPDTMLIKPGQLNTDIQQSARAIYSNVLLDSHGNWIPQLAYCLASAELISELADFANSNLAELAKFSYCKANKQIYCRDKAIGYMCTQLGIELKQTKHCYFAPKPIGLEELTNLARHGYSFCHPVIDITISKLI